MLNAAVDIWFVNIGLKISDIAKSFKIGNFSIYFYGCVIAASVMFGLLLASLVAKKTKQDPDIYLELVIYGIIFGIIGARTYYVVFAWDSYKDNLLQVFNLRNGGLAIYGGVIGATLAAFVFCKKQKLNFRKVMDTACIGLIGGQCTGRWSNFVNMECFGRYTDNFFAMRLNVANVNQSMITQELLDQSLVVDGVRYIQVHPTFLYESLWCLGSLLVLLLVTKKKKFDGEVFLGYLICYGCGRFWIEGLRTDSLMLFGTGLASSQVLSAIVVLIAAILMVRGFKHPSLRPVRLSEAAQTEEIPAGEIAEVEADTEEAEEREEELSEKLSEAVPEESAQEAEPAAEAEEKKANVPEELPKD